jgi:hypothetical protein
MVVALIRSAEIWVLRQQINVLRRTAPKKLSFSAIDRLIFVGLYRLFPKVRLYCRGKNANARRASDHIFLTTVVSSGLHILKMVFDQERPDHRPFRGTGGVSRSQASGSTHFHLAIPYTSGRWLPRPVRFP